MSDHSRTLRKYLKINTSDHIPSEIQEKIMKKLPVKPLVRFRSVSKQWKSLIDSSKFIKDYHINHANPQQHLLVQHPLDDEIVRYISIIDDNTFPNHKFSVTYHDPEEDLISNQHIVGSSQGIICICGSRGGLSDMAVLWNPTVRKSIGVVIPRLSFYSGLHFGVCPNTNDPKLVYLSVYTMKWEAKVFTLSTKVWKTLTIPSTIFNNIDWCQMSRHVCTQGFIYFLAVETRIKSKLIVSFDLRSEHFGQVNLPDSILHSRGLELSKRNECLTLLELFADVNNIHVWMMNDSVTKSFTKVFTLKSLGPLGWGAVVGFRKNGKALIRRYDDVTEIVSLVEVCDPCSGRINYIGINWVDDSSRLTSYVETLLLLDETHFAVC